MHPILSSHPALERVDPQQVSCSVSTRRSAPDLQPYPFDPAAHKEPDLLEPELESGSRSLLHTSAPPLRTPQATAPIETRVSSPICQASRQYDPAPVH